MPIQMRSSVAWYRSRSISYRDGARYQCNTNYKCRRIQWIVWVREHIHIKYIHLVFYCCIVQDLRNTYNSISQMYASTSDRVIGFEREYVAVVCAWFHSQTNRTVYRNTTNEMLYMCALYLSQMTSYCQTNI